jgi:hypothetical protein
MCPTNKKLFGVPLDTRLAKYTALAGAALAAPAIPNTEAAIVYSGPVNIVIPVTTAGVYLNVVSNVSNTDLTLAPGWDVNPFGSASLAWFGPSPAATSGYVNNFPGGTSATLVDNLPIGTPISNALGYTWATDTTASETSGVTAFNLNSDNNYVGFRFVDPSINGGAVSFGWLQIHLGATSNDPTRAITGYAYENTGGAILAGAVPEPSTTALLGVMAAGAVGVRAWRKRKAA